MNENAHLHNTRIVSNAFLIYSKTVKYIFIVTILILIHAFSTFVPMNTSSKRFFAGNGRSYAYYAFMLSVTCTC